MWYLFQILVMFAVGAFMIHVGAKNGHDIGVAAYIVAFGLTIGLSYLFRLLHRLREIRRERGL